MYRRVRRSGSSARPEDGRAAPLSLREVTKTYASGVKAVDRVSLRIAGGEFMVLVGPSGCGKSTILRLIAGLEEVTEGRIFLGDSDITNLPPPDRDIAMVFQNYALYPHMTVARNLGFGLKVGKVAKSEIRARVEEAARILGLLEVLDRRPDVLSGGQRQRVAIGRAMVRDPAAFLMDEPLSNLDAKLRVHMRGELARLRKRLRTTTVFVTHDQVEAMTLGDRVAVLRDGLLQQVDTPQQVYRNPANTFVAGFIGSPAMNLVRATVSQGALRLGDLVLPLGFDPLRPTGSESAVILGIRPSAFRDVRTAGASGWPEFDARIDVREELGEEVNLLFTVEAPPGVPENDASGMRGGWEDELLDHRGRGEATIFTARVSALTRAGPGRRVRLAVDPSAFYYFDVHNGVALHRPTETRGAGAERRQSVT